MKWAMAMAMAMAMASSVLLSAEPYFDFHSDSHSSSPVLYGVDCHDAQLNLMEYHPAMDEKALIEFNAYKDWILSQRSWKAEQVCVHDLDADKLSYLESLAETDGRAASEAKTLLMLNERLDIQAEVVIPTPSPKSRLAAGEQVNTEGLLSIFPNPADEYVTVDYRIDRAFQELEAIIYDIQGRQVLTLRLMTEAMNQQLISHELESGTYLLELHVDGQPYKSLEFQVR